MVFLVIFLLVPGEADAQMYLSVAELQQAELKVGNGRVLIPVVKGLPGERVEREVNKNIRETVKSAVAPVPGSSLTGEAKVVFFNDYLIVLHFAGYTETPGGGATMVDKGIHIDLQTARIYELRSLFDRETVYADWLLAFCAKNPDKYRLDDGRGGSGWYFDDFSYAWHGGLNREFLLTEDYLRIYTSDRYGATSGYGIPYGELSAVLAEDGAFWQALEHKGNRAGDYVFYEPPLGWQFYNNEQKDDDIEDKAVIDSKALTVAKAQVGSLDVLLHDSSKPSWNVQNVAYNNEQDALIIKGYYNNNSSLVITKVKELKMNVTLKDSEGNIRMMYSAVFPSHTLMIQPGTSESWTYKMVGVSWDPKYTNDWDVRYSAKYAMGKPKKT